MSAGIYSHIGSVLWLEQSGEQRGHGGFNPQDACAELHRLQAGLGQQVDFVGDPAAFGADGQCDRFIQATRAGWVVAGVADQALGALRHRRQAVFDEMARSASR